jgi:3-oxosteroid 1-dehydrogenase
MVLPDPPLRPPHAVWSRASHGFAACAQASCVIYAVTLLLDDHGNDAALLLAGVLVPCLISLYACLHSGTLSQVLGWAMSYFLHWHLFFHPLIATCLVGATGGVIDDIGALALVGGSGLLAIAFQYAVALDRRTLLLTSQEVLPWPGLFSSAPMIVEHAVYVSSLATWVFVRTANTDATVWTHWASAIVVTLMALVPLQLSLARILSSPRLYYLIDGATTLLLTGNVIAATALTIRARKGLSDVELYVACVGYGALVLLGNTMYLFAYLSVGQYLPAETDVLVVGSGMAGLTTVLRASESRQVVCVEAGRVIGGTTRLSGGGIYVPNNAWKQSLGGVERCSEFENFIARDNGAPLTPREQMQVARYFRSTTKAIDFLVGKGLRFKLSLAPSAALAANEAFCRKHNLDPRLAQFKTDYDTSNNSSGIARTLFSAFSLVALLGSLQVFIKENGVRAAFSLRAGALVLRSGYLAQGNGAALVRQLKQAVDRTSAVVLVRKRLVRLVRQDDGRWLANFEDGSRTLARDVVLATGGAGANQRVVQERFSRLAIKQACTCDSNLGLVGVITPRPASRYAAWLKQCRTHDTTQWLGGRIQSWFLSGDYMYMVDGTGRRFVNEYASYGHRARTQGTRRAFLVFDSRAMRQFGGAPGSPIPPHPTRFTRAFDTEAAYVEWMCSELGDSQGLFRQTLRATIAEFERAGEDAIRKTDKASNFNWVSLEEAVLVRKTPSPPYYIIELSQAILDTVGECDTDARGRCLDENRRAIDHLFAAGNAAAPLTDRSNYSSGGITLGKATCDGFVIGSFLCDNKS